MFVRLFVDENLDRMVPISKQPKEKIQAIIDSCTRQFPEFAERARKRIRTYLKSCRRNKKVRDGWDSTVSSSGYFWHLPLTILTLSSSSLPLSSLVPLPRIWHPPRLNRFWRKHAKMRVWTRSGCESEWSRSARTTSSPPHRRRRRVSTKILTIRPSIWTEVQRPLTVRRSWRMDSRRRRRRRCPWVPFMRPATRRGRIIITRRSNSTVKRRRAAVSPAVQ